MTPSQTPTPRKGRRAQIPCSRSRQAPAIRCLLLRSASPVVMLFFWFFRRGANLFFSTFFLDEDEISFFLLRGYNKALFGSFRHGDIGEAHEADLFFGCPPKQCQAGPASCLPRLLVCLELRRVSLVACHHVSLTSFIFSSPLLLPFPFFLFFPQFPPVLSNFIWELWGGGSHSPLFFFHLSNFHLLFFSPHLPSLSVFEANVLLSQFF